MLDASKANWCSRREDDTGGIMQKDETNEFDPPKDCCHSNHRYFYQRLLSIVS